MVPLVSFKIIYNIIPDNNLVGWGGTAQYGSPQDQHHILPGEEKAPESNIPQIKELVFLIQSDHDGI